MEKAKTQNINGYFEKHHIIPKSLGGNNDATNIVKLTARQHFIAHHLLSKMTSGVDKRKMYSAFWLLKHIKNQKLTARQFEILRQNYCESTSFFQKGKKKSIEHKANMCKGKKSQKEKGLQVGGVYSKEHLAALHKGSQMYWTGRTFSEERKKEISAKIRGAGNPNAKTWTLENEEGDQIIIRSCKTWCTEKGFSQYMLKNTVKNGKFYRGYRIIGNT